MKKIRIGRWFLFAFIACILLGLWGCGGKQISTTQNVQKEENEEKKDTVRIGLSVDSFVIERWIRDRDVFVAEAKELGAEVNVQDAGGNVQEQISQIEYFIKKQMNVIMVIASDCEALAEVLKKAHDAGIKTISYDRLVIGAGTDLYISFDNTQVGKFMAEALLQKIPSGGEIFMIQGAAEDNNVRMVREGFDSVIKNSNLQVVYESNCEGWRAEDAVGYMEEALQKYPNVKGIMCGNDDIASQVIQVLAEYKKAGDVVVVGQDGDVAACQRIVEETQYMTAFKAVDELARQAAHYAVALGKGEEMQDLTGEVEDGLGKVPSKILDPIAVTKDNMDSVIIDGRYHNREDVYLNVN